MSSSTLDPKRKSNTQLLANAQPDEDNKQLNPHMPQYITQVPWYVEKTSEPTLKHHHKFFEPEKEDINNWYDRGSKGEQATTYRKGACENCGGLGHKRKQCAERPRKIGAKFTKKDIAADDVQKHIELSGEGKRDRWNGYNPDRHKEVVEQYEAFEEVKKKRKQQEIEKKNEMGIEIGQDDEYKAPDDPLRVSNLPSKSDRMAKKYHGIINVRERQDPAKYLLNLDLNSAQFNPKSRSMNENPNPLLPDDKQRFKGDNEFNETGDKLELIEQEKFALEQAELRNSELNAVALPSLTAHVFKTVRQNNQLINSGRTGELLKRYGGEQYINNVPAEQLTETQAYFEYSNDGRLKREPQQFGRAKSRYTEDIFINDHTSVWGSWWNQFLGWGYHCCHSNNKMSVCMGLKGKELALQREYKVKKQLLKEEMDAKAAAEKSNEDNVEAQDDKIEGKTDNIV